MSEALAKIGQEITPDSMDFERYTRGVIAYLKENEESYRMVMSASSPRLFAEKLKRILAKQFMEQVPYSLFTDDPGKWQVQVSFALSACVDVITEYYRGAFPVSFDTVTEVILDAVDRLCAGRPSGKV